MVSELILTPPAQQISGFVCVYRHSLTSLSPLLHPSFQVSVIATSDDEYAKNLADRFETAARSQGIRIHVSSRFSSTASSDVLDNKLQLVRVDIVELRCCETLYDEVLGITNDIFLP